MGLTFQSSLRNSARGFSAKVALLNGRSIYEWKLYYNVFCDDLLFWEKLNINTFVLNTFYFLWKSATSLKYFEKYLIIFSYVWIVSFQENGPSFCYTKKGENYRGTVDITRNYAKCLPWTETKNCLSSTYNPMYVMCLL